MFNVTLQYGAIGSRIVTPAFVSSVMAESTSLARMGIDIRSVISCHPLSLTYFMPKSRRPVNQGWESNCLVERWWMLCLMTVIVLNVKKADGINTIQRRCTVGLQLQLPM